MFWANVCLLTGAFCLFNDLNTRRRFTGQTWDSRRHICCLSTYINAHCCSQRQQVEAVAASWTLRQDCCHFQQSSRLRYAKPPTRTDLPLQLNTPITDSWCSPFICPALCLQTHLFKHLHMSWMEKKKFCICRQVQACWKSTLRIKTWLLGRVRIRFWTHSRWGL